jgi:hypothetical protein
MLIRPYKAEKSRYLGLLLGTNVCKNSHHSRKKAKIQTPISIKYDERG